VVEYDTTSLFAAASYRESYERETCHHPCVISLVDMVLASGVALLYPCFFTPVTAQALLLRGGLVDDGSRGQSSSLPFGRAESCRRGDLGTERSLGDTVNETRELEEESWFKQGR
jgi:hypothetical protein